MKITTTIHSQVTPAAYLQHDLLRKRDVQTCGDLKGAYNSNIAAPSCTGAKSMCLFTNNMQGCYDNSGSSQLYTTCNPAGSPMTCGGSDSRCLSCTNAGTTNCIKYALFQTSVGTFYGFGCGVSYVDPHTTIWGVASSYAAIATTSNAGTSISTTASAGSSNTANASPTSTLASSALTTSSRASVSSSTTPSSAVTSLSSSTSSRSSSSSFTSSTRTGTAADSTTTGTASPSPSVTSSSSLSTGAIAGIAVGAAALLILAILAGYLLLRPRRQPRVPNSPQQPMMQQYVRDY